MQTVAVQTRIPKKMKEEAGKIFEELGLDFSTASRMFYSQVIINKGLPFQVTVSIQKEEMVWDGTEEEEKEWNKQVAYADWGRLWDSPEDDVWDDILPKLPPIDTV